MKLPILLISLLLIGCTSDDPKEYNRGYEHGALDTAHRDYWAIQNTQHNVQTSSERPRSRYETVPGPTQVGEVKMVPNTTTIITSP